MKHPKTDSDKISLPGVLDVIRNEQGVCSPHLDCLLRPFFFVELQCSVLKLATSLISTYYLDPDGVPSCGQLCPSQG
jgi:hypothetical protein